MPYVNVNQKLGKENWRDMRIFGDILPNFFQKKLRA